MAASVILNNWLCVNGMINNYVLCTLPDLIRPPLLISCWYFWTVCSILVIHRVWQAGPGTKQTQAIPSELLVVYVLCYTSGNNLLTHSRNDRLCVSWFVTGATPMIIPLALWEEKNIWTLY